MFETLPGFREFYPDAFAVRRALFESWRRTLQLCGFEEYEGAVLEPLELYVEKSGEEIVDQLFHFTDKGGRKVAMRPEMTPTLARMVGSRANALRRPVKWFNIGDHFRYERMQKGRTRSFTQLNVDILGESGVKADVESISTLVSVCRRLGLKSDQFVVRVSDRDLWLMALSALGVTEAAQTGVLAVIDKVERSTDEQTLESLRNAVGPDVDAEVILTALRRLFALKDLASMHQFFGTLQDVGPELSERIHQRLSTWQELIDGLQSLGSWDCCEVDLRIVRGLAYYTGFVFEAFEKGRSSRALAGGGRYDHLIQKLGGPDFPAVGWAMGDVTMMDCLNYHSLAPKLESPARVFAAMEEQTTREAMSDVGRLRDAGVGVSYSYKKAGFGKQFKEANQLGCNWLLIYGGDEVSAGEVLVKDLATGTEQRVARDHLIRFFRERGIGDAR